MQTLHFKLSLLAALLIGLSGCTTSHNKITQVAGENTIVKYADHDPSRFENLYPKKPEYPITCQEDCYPETAIIACKSEMENCQYRAKTIAPPLGTGYSVQWLGHASFMIHTPEGQQVLLDPVSKQFDWPVNWAFRLTAGFNRNPATNLSQAELHATDAVLYSHIHYDHFNKDDIAQIGSGPEYLTPLGFAEHFPNDGYKITEMAWYGQKQINGLDINFVPAHHFSSRIWVPFLYDDNDETLWGGWLLEQQGKTLFFAGDTGYSKHFKDIQARFGDIDVCLIPIASYHHEEYGNWYRYVHTTPEDALIAAKDLNCKVMIPWGYGNASWKMGDHTSHSALFRLLKMQKEIADTPPLLILNEGDKVTL